MVNESGEEVRVDPTGATQADERGRFSIGRKYSGERVTCTIVAFETGTWTADGSGRISPGKFYAGKTVAPLVLDVEESSASAPEDARQQLEEAQKFLDHARGADDMESLKRALGAVEERVDALAENIRYEQED